MQVCSVVAGYRAQGLGHAFEAAMTTKSHGDQDVVAPARLQVVEHFHPELGPLGVLYPYAQDVFAAVGQHAQSQVDGLAAHHVIFPNLHPQGVEEDHRVHRL